jgi:inosine-uridine nucleoside N-ribohydrolase
MKRLLPVLLALACHKPPMAPPAPLPLPRTLPAPLPVWLDADPSVGLPGRDVDDGLAILQALRSDELAVRGLSTVFGNAALSDVDPIARALLTTWSPDLPVHTGAAEASLAPTDASRALIAALEREALTVLALGPVTNVAAALQARPDLAGRVRELIVVAGRRPGQRFTTGTVNPKGHRDLNFEQDPAAMELLLSMDLRIVLAPFEVSSKVWINEAWLAGLEGSEAAPLLEPARAWLGLWREKYGVEGFNPFDALAVGYLVRRDLIDCVPGFAVVERGPDDRVFGAEAGEKPYLHVRGEGVGRSVLYCGEVRAEGFLGDLAGRLTAP